MNYIILEVGLVAVNALLVTITCQILFDV